MSNSCVPFFDSSISSLKYFFGMGMFVTLIFILASEGAARGVAKSAKGINAGFRDGNGSMSRMGHVNNSRYRWRYQARSRISDQRQRGQNARQELRRMMIPGYQQGSLGQNSQRAVRERVHSMPRLPHNKGEFVLPEDAKNNLPVVSSEMVVKDKEKERMDKHKQRYEAMSDSQRAHMQKQMRRVRPLSTEERGDVAERPS